MFFFLVTSKGILQQIRNIDVRKDMVAKKKKKGKCFCRGWKTDNG